jgi:predicted Co/Zn/Cd cation transporter (cation efflux family)
MRVILMLAAVYALIVAIDARLEGARSNDVVVTGSTFTGSD